MKVKDITCLGLFEIMDSVSKLIAKDKEVAGVRGLTNALPRRGFKLYFSPIRTELYYGGYVSEDREEIIMFMDYYLKVMKNKELKRREKVLDSFLIRKSLILGNELKEMSEIANEFIKWIVALSNGAVKLADEYERNETAKL